uniref:FAS1 domain-containing protein n=1 Tax=Daphnia galeata TaxID=27404 RepID=A0A8J2RRA2_9CRUS|nr:unnamed protein product [Daphnia galeata]
MNFSRVILAYVALLSAFTFAYTPSKNSRPKYSKQPTYNPSKVIDYKLLYFRIKWFLNFSQGNILDVLKENGLTTFVDLIIKAGLEVTFSQPRPFIVWAPTNEAFAAIGPETLNFILSDASLLKDILTYHLGLFLQTYTLVPAIKDELTLPTVQGEVTRINVYRKKGSSFVSERTVTVNGALVVNALPAGDSIIYVIDRVLSQPSRSLDIVELSATIRSKTLFAPTDTAFQALPAGLLDSLFANPKELVKLLNNHIASGTFYSRGFVSGPLPVVSGITVDVDLSPTTITIGDANVIDADITTIEGVLHVVDAVIFKRQYRI